MLSDERLDIIIGYGKTFPSDEKVILANEIKRLRAENEQLRDGAKIIRKEWEYFRHELSRYKTPQVDAAYFPDPDCVCHETGVRNCPVHQNDGGRR